MQKVRAKIEDEDRARITRIDRHTKSHDEKSSLFKNRFEISLIINLTLSTNPIRPFQGVSVPIFAHGEESTKSRSTPLPPLFSPDEDVFQQLLSDEAVGPGRALRGPSVQSAVDGVQFRAQLASDVEPPIAHEHCLAELRAVRAQERCLASVYVAIMPRLASRLHVREEAWIGLVVAVEIRVRHLAQHGIIGASSTCKQKKRIFDKLVRFFFEFLEIFVQI